MRTNRKSKIKYRAINRAIRGKFIFKSKVSRRKKKDYMKRLFAPRIWRIHRNRSKFMANRLFKLSLNKNKTNV